MPTPSWRDLQYMVEQKQKGYSVDPKYDAYFESIKNIGEREPLQLNRQTAPAYLQATGEQVREANEALAEYSNDFGIDYGAYKGDATVPFSQFINDPVNYRANSQSNGEKLRNGAIKLFPYMATTFLDNTVGLVDAALVSGPFKDGRNYLDNFINSWTGEAMQKVRDWSEEKLPNYRTTQELDDQEHWWKYMNANFWGDTFIKNLGFTLGAGLSGGLAAKGFRAMQGKVVRDAYKAAVAAAVDGNAAAESTFEAMMRNGMLQNPNKVYKAFNKGSKSFGKLSMQSQLIGGLTGAIGESRVEALNAAKEFREPAVEKAQQKLMQDTRALEQEMYNPENGYTENIPVYDGYGNIVGSNIGLSEEGQKVLAERQQKLQEQYDKEVAAIDNEAYKVAYTTFGLNLPVLTGSNIVMFGRYFSGGFNTQKGIKLRGTLGDYKGTGSVGKAIGMGVKNAATEGMEELTQKVISEGAKDIADSNMAAFHNGKYDTEAIKNWSMDWLSSMGQSAENVIHDPTSWEEFAVGFLTGALGMPTRVGVRNWSGGIIGGIQEGLQERNQSSELANNLNERVQDPKFRALWEGAIRHNVYERQKDAALNIDDSYTWHSANDKQLLSDVMMFADAGRLQDLESVVDTFANVTEEDINSTDLIDDGDPRFANMNDSEKVDWLKKRAEDVKKTIKRFKDSRDAINFAEFKVSPDSEAMNELIYTQASLFNIADRYDSILGEMLSDIRGTISINATNGNATAQEILNGLNNMQNVFLGYSDVAESSRQIGQSPSVHMLNDAEIDEVKKNLNAMKTIAGSGWERKIDDLQKLINDGRNLYSKLYSQEFKDSFAKKFEEQAKQPEQVADAIEQAAKEQKAESYMDELNEASGGINSIEQMHKAYKAADDKPLFIEAVRKKAKDGDGLSDTYIRTYDVFNDFKESLKAKHPEIVNKRTGGFNRVTDIILDRLFTDSKNENTFLKQLGSNLINLDAVNAEMQALVENGTITDDEALPIMVAQLYNTAVNAITDTIPEFVKGRSGIPKGPSAITEQAKEGPGAKAGKEKGVDGPEASSESKGPVKPGGAERPGGTTSGAKESTKESDLDTHPVVRAALTSFKGFPDGVTEVGYVDQSDYPFVRFEKNGRKFMLTFSLNTKGKIKGDIFEYNKKNDVYKPLDVEPEKYFEQAKKAVSSYVPDSFIDLLQKYADDTVDEDRFSKELHDKFNIYYLNTTLLGTKYEASDSNINLIKKELLGKPVPVGSEIDERQVEVSIEPEEEPLPEEPEPGEAIEDSYSEEIKEGPSASEAEVTTRGGEPMVGYYQQSIPEIETFNKDGNIMVQIKNKIKEMQNVPPGREGKARISALEWEINSLVKDFVKFDEKDNPTKNKAFAPTYKWLRDNHAFEYIANRLDVDQPVVFCYMAGCPRFNGKPQVVVAAIKERDEEGNIESVQPLTILSRPNAEATKTRAKYAYLDELYDAIISDFDSRGPDGPLYVFGGKKNPVMSRVFWINPGVVPFGAEQEDIRTKEGYTDFNPIVVIGANEAAITLRGDMGRYIPFTPRRNNFAPGQNRSRYGKLYYMAHNGNSSYIPILLEVKTLSRELLDSSRQAKENGIIDRTRKQLAKIDNLVARFNGSNAFELNGQLGPELTALNRLIALNKMTIKFDDTGLTVSWEDKSGEHSRVAKPGGDSFFDIMADASRPIQISLFENRREDAKRNLNDAIAEGLVTSDAKALRQKGVNFMFDPWNPATAKFERLLTSPTAVTDSGENTEVTIPQEGGAETETETEIANETSFGTVDEKLLKESTINLFDLVSVANRIRRADGDLREAGNKLPDKFHEYLTYATKGKNYEQSVQQLIRIAYENRGNAAADAILKASSYFTRFNPANNSESSGSSGENIVLDYTATYDELTQEQKDYLTSKGVSKDMWDMTAKDDKKSLLDC